MTYLSSSVEWPAELIRQLQVIGTILANARGRQKSQEAGWESERRFRHLFDKASIGIALEDLDGKLLFVNPALCAMLGYTENELLAIRCAQFSDPEDELKDESLFQQLQTGLIRAYHIEKRFFRKDEERIWGNLHVSLVKSGPSKPFLVNATLEDITARKAAEEGLRSAKQNCISWQPG